MPKGLYDLSTGFDDINLLNLQIDTFERFNDISKYIEMPTDQNVSIKNFDAFVPKDITPDDILTKKDDRLLSVKDGLMSSDPNIYNLTKNYIDAQSTKNPVSRGVGTSQYVPYTEGQNKFTNDSFFKGKRNTMYGYNPYISLAENEDFNNRNVWNSYTNFGKAWRGTGLFLGKTVSKAVTGLVGMVGDLGSMAWNGLEELGEALGGSKNNFWNDVSNNWLSRKMEEANDHVKNQWFPTYKALNYDNKGAWEKLFDPYTWTNTMADGAGFLLQFAVPGALFGKLGQAGRIANNIGKLEKELVAAEAVGDSVKVANIGKTIAEAKKVNSFIKAMGYDVPGFSGKALNVLTGSDNIGGISAHIYNTMMESVAETKEGFKSTVDDLVKQGYTEEKAIEIAGENAPGQFWLNTAILSISNAFENKFIQKAVGNRKFLNIDDLTASTLPKGIIPAEKGISKFFEANKWGNRIKFYGSNYGKAAFFEGFWEENAQTAAARWARGEYERQGDDGGGIEKSSKTFINQLWKQTKDAIAGNDREAADSIMAGAVIGVLGNTIFSKLAGTRNEILGADGKTIIKEKSFLPEGQRKIQQREIAQKTAQFINLRDAWLSLSAFDTDVYNKDGSVNEDKAKLKYENIIEKLSKLNIEVSKTISLDNLTDKDQKEALESQIFASYVKAHILNETGDALVDRLKDWKEKSIEELAAYGVTPELKENSSKWASKAEKYVELYKIADEIKYAAPSNTNLKEYLDNTEAIKSLIYDYSIHKDIAEDNLAKANENINLNNPFKDTPDLQNYNKNQVKLIKLKQKLENENLDIIEKEKIQKQIDDSEKIQKETEDLIKSLGEYVKSPEGLYFLKNIDKNEASKKIEEYQDFFKNISDKVDNNIAIEKYDDLIKEYSNPDKGYAKFTNTANHWENVYSKSAKAKEEETENKNVLKTKEEITKAIKELEEQLKDVKTESEKQNILKQLEELKAILADLEDDFDVDQDKDDDDDTDDIPPPPPDIQYGTDEYINQALAYVTPFKTVNKETIDAKDAEGNRLAWKEIVLEHGYDHDLSIFVKNFLHNQEINSDKYEAYLIKDTEEYLKQRLSKTQLENFDANKFELGAILVFKEKGNDNYLTFKNNKLIAFSYNEKAFNFNYDERVRINSAKTNRSTQEVIEFFKKQQAILEAAREKVITENVVIPLKVISGSLGVDPMTFPGKAIERFEGFYDKDNPLTISTFETVNLIPNGVLGQVYLNIPANKTVKEIPHYIRTYTTTLNKGETGSIQEKIYNSIQAIQLSTFKTKKEAISIIKNYLYNIFYIGDTIKFEIIKDNNGFKIQYKDSKGIYSNWLNKPILKVSNELYNTEVGFSIYEKVGDTFQPTIKINKENYREFIANHLQTKHKVLIQNIKNKGERIYTELVNSYFNLSAVNEMDVQLGDSSKTTEQAIIETSVKTTTSVLEDKKANIERRRQKSLAFSDKPLQSSFGAIHWDRLGVLKGTYYDTNNDPFIVTTDLPNGVNSKGVRNENNDKLAIEDIKRQLNAKYDAELAALEQKPTTDIKKTRLEELENTIPEEFEKKFGKFKIVQRNSEVRGKYDATFQEITNLDNGYGVQRRISKDGKITYSRFASGNKVTFEGEEKEEHIKYKQDKSEFEKLSDKQKTSDEEYLKIVLGESSFKELPLYDPELAALNNKEISVIKAFQGKTFTILKPYTDILQNPSKSIEDKIQVLKEISDQMLAPATAERVSEELGKELSNLIDDLGYEAPIENEELKQASENNIIQKEYDLEEEISNLELKLEDVKAEGKLLIAKVLETRLAELKAQKKPVAQENKEPNLLEKLKALANEGLNINTNMTPIVPHTFEGSKFKIDFDNNVIEGYFEDSGEEFTKDFYNSFSNAVYTKSTIKDNNGLNYYFVKHKGLSKFVSFDDNLKFYKVNELPQKIQESKEFKEIENCN